MQLFVGERRHDEQDSIGTDGAGFGNLPAVDDEVFADDRQVTGGTRCLQVGISPLEVINISQHRQAGGAMLGIRLGNGGGVKVGADHALGGAGFFDFGDDR